MIPIHELLSRIRWDPAFGRGDFAIGYYDRLEREILMVPLSTLGFDPEDHFSFRLTAASGESHRIPLHRVYDVYRNGRRIWHREHPPESAN